MRISDRTLQRWLRTGKPKRVEHRLDDPGVSERLEAMTKLTTGQTEALTDLTAPPPELIERVTTKIAERSDNEALGVVLDLYGLAWHTASAMLISDDPPDNPH